MNDDLNDIPYVIEIEGPAVILFLDVDSLFVAWDAEKPAFYSIEIPDREIGRVEHIHLDDRDVVTIFRGNKVQLEFITGRPMLSNGVPWLKILKCLDFSKWMYLDDSHEYTNGLVALRPQGKTTEACHS